MCLVFLFRSGVFSTSKGASFFFFLAPLQFPRTVAQLEFTTLNAWVFFTNSETFGFSFTLPLCRCCPKKFSRGSWHILLLRNTVTPGIVKTYSTNSTNEKTAIKYKLRIDGAPGVHYIEKWPTLVLVNV